MKLPAIDIRHGVGHDMDMKVLTVLMYPDEALMLREEFICKCPADFKTLIKGYDFILMKADDVMGVHPSGILAP